MIAQLSSIPINLETIYLIEALKVEAYWNRKNFTLTIQNKDIPFLNKIEEIVSKLGINVSKRILLKIRLKDKSKKQDVKIIEDNKKLNFHIEKSPFNQDKVKAVTSLPHKKEYKLKVYIKNKIYSIKIVTRKKKLDYESKLDCWLYGDARFPCKKILDFLDEYTGGNNNLHVENQLLNSKPEIVMSAFSALIDCEGSINWYGLKRVIIVRMRDKNYLSQWSKLLKKFGIGNKLRKHAENWELDISGWEDFDRLDKLGFKLHHSGKMEKWGKLMRGFKRNQISRGSYKLFYTNKLKELNKKITSKEFADILGKSKRVIDHYLLKLEREGLISCNRNVWPYLYFISTSSVR